MRLKISVPLIRLEVGRLDIELLSSFFTDKIDFSISGFSNRHLSSPAQKLHIDYIFKNQVNIPHIASIDGFPDAMVGNAINFYHFIVYTR